MCANIFIKACNLFSMRFKLSLENCNSLFLSHLKNHLNNFTCDLNFSPNFAQEQNSKIGSKFWSHLPLHRWDQKLQTVNNVHGIEFSVPNSQLYMALNFQSHIFNVMWDQIFSFNCSMGPKLGCHVKLGPKLYHV